MNINDIVEVIAKIDYQGLQGKIIEIVEGQHKYKVKFNEQLWCCYSEDELQIIKEDSK
jgi:membrane protein implicated in regulation of membrane protease activity